MLNNKGFYAETAIVYSESRCIVFKLVLCVIELTIRNHTPYRDLLNHQDFWKKRNV